MRLISKVSSNDKDIIKIGVAVDELVGVELFVYVNTVQIGIVEVVDGVITIELDSLVLKDILEIKYIASSKSYPVFSYVENAIQDNYAIVSNTDICLNTKQTYVPLYSRVTYTDKYGVPQLSQVSLNLEFLDNYNRGFEEGFILGQLL